MCLAAPSHVLNGIPHAANVYDPFVEAATGIIRQLPPLPPPAPPSSFHPPLLPPPRSRTICRFRALARRVLGNANHHSQIRREIVQYLDTNRDIDPFQTAITSGIGVQQLPILGEHPRLDRPYDQYLQLMSNSATYMGKPEILAAPLKHGRMIHVSLNSIAPAHHSDSQFRHNPLAFQSNVQTLRLSHYCLPNVHYTLQCTSSRCLGLPYIGVLPTRENSYQRNSRRFETKDVTG